MPIGVRWRLQTPQVPLFDARQRQQETARVLSTTLRAALQMQDAALVRHTPVGVAGRARSAWEQRVDILSTQPLRLTGENVNPTPYARPLDEGQTPHWMPWGPGSDLALWAQRKLGDRRLAFLVARAIATGRTRGTALRGSQMVAKTVAATRGPVLALFRRARQQLARRWLGR